MNKIMNDKFPKGIEAAAAGLIRRKDGKLLFARSPKWADKWVIPGGHIEIGETIVDATLREVKEETNLDATYVVLLRAGEMIEPEDFKRSAHFIYFTSLLTTEQDEPILDNDELVEYKWVTPEEALQLPLAAENEKIIEKYLEYMQSKKDS